MPERNLWNSFLLYLVVEILQLVHEIRCSIKEVFWKTSQNSQINTKSSHPEVFSQKMFWKILQNSQKKHLCRILPTACSQTPVRGSFFNKVASLMPVSHRYFSVNFEKFLGKLFCITPPSNHFSHDVFFPFFMIQISEVCSLKSIHLVEQW